MICKYSTDLSSKCQLAESSAHAARTEMASLDSLGSYLLPPRTHACLRSDQFDIQGTVKAFGSHLVSCLPPPRPLACLRSDQCDIQGTAQKSHCANASGSQNNAQNERFHEQKKKASEMGDTKIYRHRQSQRNARSNTESAPFHATR